MGDSSDIGALTLAVGQMQGQLRELVHTQNNMAQKLDGLTTKMFETPTRSDFEKLEKRVEALEAEHHRNTGAKGVVLGFLKSPIAAWIAAAIAAAYAYIKGVAQ